MITFLGFRISERQFLFSYLLVATLLLSALAGWIFYNTYDFPPVNALYLSDKIKRQQNLFRVRARYLPTLDSTHRAITAYRPEMTAVFLEADIDNQINDLKQLYRTNPGVLTYKAFAQAADFYQMMYTDKRVLWSKQSNLKYFQKQLEECAVGFQLAPPGSSISPVHTSGASTQSLP